MARRTGTHQLAGILLFADLSHPQLESLDRVFDEEAFDAGQRILRQGFSGSNFYVITEGEARVEVDGRERATLGRGDCFGEISILLGSPPSADVVAIMPLRCLVLPAEQLREFLLSHPTVMYRMLQAEAHRLYDATRWPS